MCSCQACLQTAFRKMQLPSVGVPCVCTICDGSAECPYCKPGVFCETCMGGRLCPGCRGLKLEFN